MLAHKIGFSPDCDESFFQQLPDAAAVFVLRGAGGAARAASSGDPDAKAVYGSKTANLRRRLLRMLGRPEAQSKRLNLRNLVSGIEFTPTGSDFESQFLLYKLLRDLFPESYAARLRLRPAPLVKLHMDNAYPRASVTTRLSSHGSNIYYGPFFSRATAEKFANDALDFFRMRRCVDDLNPDPAFPGCVYSEMKMCLAPCFKGCTDDEYQAEVARVQAFFDSGGDSLARELGEQRDHASAGLAFEEAAGIHSKLEKLKPLLAQLPEIVRRLDRLDAVIVQPAADPDSVCLFRLQDMQILGPAAFRVERRGEPNTSGSSSTTAAPQFRSMESRVEESINSCGAPVSASSLDRTENLAILKRWFYRSHRTGEIFLRDDKGAWPLRRIVRGIGRVSKGEKPEEPALFSATQSIPAQS